jgi:hypothetical protein
MMRFYSVPGYEDGSLHNSINYTCSDEAFLLDPTFQEDIQKEFLNQDEATQGKAVASVLFTLITSMKALREKLDVVDKEQAELRDLHHSFPFVLDILYKAVKKERHAWKIKDVVRYIRPMRGGEIFVLINKPQILKVDGPEIAFLKELRDLTYKVSSKIHDDAAQLDDYADQAQKLYKVVKRAEKYLGGKYRVPYLSRQKVDILLCTLRTHCLQRVQPAFCHMLPVLNTHRVSQEVVSRLDGHVRAIPPFIEGAEQKQFSKMTSGTQGYLHLSPPWVVHTSPCLIKPAEYKWRIQRSKHTAFFLDKDAM